MTRKVFAFEIVLIVAALAAVAFAWPHLPARVPTHWNLQGRVDGYGTRWSLVWFGPGFMAGIMVLTWLLPWLSPRNFKVDSFKSTYRLVMLMLFCFMAYLFGVMFLATFGYPIDAGRAITAGVCLLLALIGNRLGKIRRNFYIGLRTPWTLASERVWNASHRFAARILVVAGLIGFILAIAGLIEFAVMAIIAASLASVVYSLVYYKQLERRGELGDPLARG
jgi:uncharacterized membrane protein